MAGPFATVAAVIARKDIVQRVRDRSAYLVGVVAPLALAVVINATFGGAGTSTPQLELGVVDEDRGPVAAAFDEFAADLARTAVATFVPLHDLQAARDAVEGGDLAAAVVLRPGLSAAVVGGGPGEILVVGDPESPVRTAIAGALATGFASEVDAARLAVATSAATWGGEWTADDQAQALARFGTLERPLRVDDDPVAARGFDLTTYYAISISVLFLFFTVQFGVVGLIEERATGTLARLLAAPVSRPAVLVGKFAAAGIVGLASMAVLVVTTSVVVGASWGSVAPVALLFLMGVLAAISLSALVGTIATTPDQAGSWSSFVALGMGILGGAFFPLVFAPAPLQVLSRLTPNRWLLEGLRDASFGAGVGGVLDSLAALALFVVVVGGLALARAGRLVPRG